MSRTLLTAVPAAVPTAVWAKSRRVGATALAIPPRMGAAAPSRAPINLFSV